MMADNITQNATNHRGQFKFRERLPMSYGNWNEQEPDDKNDPDIGKRKTTPMKHGHHSFPGLPGLLLLATLVVPSVRAAKHRPVFRLMTSDGAGSPWRRAGQMTSDYSRRVGCVGNEISLVRKANERMNRYRILAQMKGHCILPWIAGLLALFQGTTQADGSSVLANDKIRVALSDDGKLEAVGNLLAAETYSFGSDSFALDTDLGMFSNATTSPVRVTADTQRIVYEFEFGPETAGGVASIKVDLIYTLTADNGFFRRTLSVSNAVPLRVKDLVFGRTTFSSPARETVHYVTFIAAPTVEFIRHDKGGLFTGIENPYFQADLSEQGVTLGFEPALILKAGDGYTSEPQFMGVYKKSGVMIEDTRPRFSLQLEWFGLQAHRPE